MSSQIESNRLKIKVSLNTGIIKEWICVFPNQVQVRVRVCVVECEQQQIQEGEYEWKGYRVQVKSIDLVEKWVGYLAVSKRMSELEIGTGLIKQQMGGFDGILVSKGDRYMGVVLHQASMPLLSFISQHRINKVKYDKYLNQYKRILNDLQDHHITFRPIKPLALQYSPLFHRPVLQCSHNYQVLQLSYQQCLFSRSHSSQNQYQSNVDDVKAIFECFHQPTQLILTNTDKIPFKCQCVFSKARLVSQIVREGPKSILRNGEQHSDDFMKHLQWYYHVNRQYDSEQQIMQIRQTRLEKSTHHSYQQYRTHRAVQSELEQLNSLKKVLHSPIGSVPQKIRKYIQHSLGISSQDKPTNKKTTDLQDSLNCLISRQNAQTQVSLLRKHFLQAKLARKQGFFHRAVGHLRKCMALNPTDLELTVLKNEEGINWMSAGQLSKAQAAIGECIAKKEQLFGFRSSDILAQLYNLAQIYFRMQKKSKLEGILHRITTIREMQGQNSAQKLQPPLFIGLCEHQLIAQSQCRNKAVVPISKQQKIKIKAEQMPLITSLWKTAKNISAKNSKEAPLQLPIQCNSQSVCGQISNASILLRLLHIVSGESCETMSQREEQLMTLRCQSIKQSNIFMYKRVMFLMCGYWQAVGGYQKAVKGIRWLLESEQWSPSSSVALRKTLLRLYKSPGLEEQLLSAYRGNELGEWMDLGIQELYYSINFLYQRKQFIDCVSRSKIYLSHIEEYATTDSANKKKPTIGSKDRVTDKSVKVKMVMAVSLARCRMFQQGLTVLRELKEKLRQQELQELVKTFCLGLIEEDGDSYCQQAVELLSGKVDTDWRDYLGVKNQPTPQLQIPLDGMQPPTIVSYCAHSTPYDHLFDDIGRDNLCSLFSDCIDMIVTTAERKGRKDEAIHTLHILLLLLSHHLNFKQSQFLTLLWLAHHQVQLGKYFTPQHALSSKLASLDRLLGQFLAAEIQDTLGQKTTNMHKLWWYNSISSQAEQLHRKYRNVQNYGLQSGMNSVTDFQVKLSLFYGVQLEQSTLFTQIRQSLPDCASHCQQEEEI